MKKTAIVHIYNFIRMSHTEPSRFIPDDFETLQEQLILIKQYGFPGTYALKYDALTDPRYQALLKEYLDASDELGAWWEITEPLCRRAGVRFRDSRNDLLYDDRVNSAYSPGYEPEERKRLLDAYMADFSAVFGCFPTSIGSWVLDAVTVSYAHQRYGVRAACICRDQMGVDGFTLWGGWPNGVYLPSRHNLFLPAATEENRLDVPVFRLLGPDPIYNFEADVRDGLQGVYTLEPSWLTGRNPAFLRDYFSRLADDTGFGVGYAQVGQENNFLWENIRPGLAPQLELLAQLVNEGKIRLETMAATGRWFAQQYRLTPPLMLQADSDWTGGGLCAQWYACVHYRLGLLGENGHLRIRDLFLYREDYPGRYLNRRLNGTKSIFDALPLLFPQIWGGAADRPFLRFVDENGVEPTGKILFDALDCQTARARLFCGEQCLLQLWMDPGGITLHSHYRLHFDRLPVLRRIQKHRLCLEHEGYAYSVTVEQGRILPLGEAGLEISPDNGRIRLILGSDPGTVQREETIPFPAVPLYAGRRVPPMVPQALPEDAVFPWGEPQAVTLSTREPGCIRYTLDGSEPDQTSPVYQAPILFREDGVLRARLYTPDGSASRVGTWTYRFGKKDICLESPTQLDSRPVFQGQGIQDLLGNLRGSTDYLDGRWRGTLEYLDIRGCLDPEYISSIRIGFLSHHRSGIVYPREVALYTGPDQEHLQFLGTVTMPEGPGMREIQRSDAVFPVNRKIGAFRILTRRHPQMPQWCTYRGTANVFTMTDSLILQPGTGEGDSVTTSAQKEATQTMGNILSL